MDGTSSPYPPGLYLICILRWKFLLIFGIAAFPRILSQNAADVDNIVDYCMSVTQEFASVEHNFIRKHERDLKTPALFFPQKKELKFRAYEIEKRQRPFECITNQLNGSYGALGQSIKYQNLVKQCKSAQFQLQCDPDYPYRTIDGTCNNLYNPTWGSVLSCAKRLFPASYEGAAGLRKSVCGKQQLPNPTYISKHYLQDVSRFDILVSMLWLFLGQFIAHDVGDTPVTFVEDKPLECCYNPGGSIKHPQCAPILEENADHLHFNQYLPCQGFVRAAICDTCSVGPRSQMDETTAFLDLSNMYDLTKVGAKQLRKFDGSGQLKVHKTKDGDLLPIDETVDPLRCGKSANFSDPNGKNKKCNKDEDCESNEACHVPKKECFELCDLPNICGEGAVCIAINHLLECHCPSGSTGDPYIECGNQAQDLNGRKTETDDEMQGKASGEYCFKTGDRRGNQHTVLMGYHTVFVREHNRIAAELKEMNPHWTEEKIYQEARKINIAEYQVMVFREFLPYLIGHDFMSKKRLWIEDINIRTKYEPSVDPTIVAEFSAAAYRLHSLIDHRVSLFGVYGFGSSYMRNLFQYSSPIHAGKIELLFRRLGRWPLQKYDKHVVKDISQFLYKEIRGEYGYDLSSVNIQRGRDVGLPPYVDVSKHFHEDIKDIKDFDDLLQHMDPENVKQLKLIYCDVKDIDLWVGLISERIKPGRMYSTVGANIISDQFYKLKFGDRFYFEHEGQFTDEQLDTLKKASFSRLICDNTNVFSMPKDSMKFPSLSNPYVSCLLLPKVDLEKWKERPTKKISA